MKIQIKIKFSILLCIICKASFLISQVPQLWGMSEAGGLIPGGVIFSMNGDGSDYRIAYGFSSINGGTPTGSLLKTNNSLFYGMTNNGGTNDSGIIFSFNPVTVSFTKLFNFNSLNGGHPYGSLIQASNGLLYGLTQAGGTANSGVLFSYNPSLNVFTKLFNFKDSLGEIPAGNLIQATDGKLYGLTSGGGTNGSGVVFSFDIGTNNYTRLYSFNTLAGEKPLGSLVEGSNGKLYGMTFSGGTSNVGVVFMFNINTMTYSNLVNFNGSNGMYPLGSLMKTNNGKLYGMTYYGGNHGAGIIFYIDTISNALTKVFDFNYPRGITPNGTLHQAADGNLYGLAEEGGTSLLGTAFKFNPLTNTYVDIFNFSTQHYAINPVAELISY